MNKDFLHWEFISSLVYTGFQFYSGFVLDRFYPSRPANFYQIEKQSYIYMYTNVFLISKKKEKRNIIKI